MNEIEHGLINSQAHTACRPEGFCWRWRICAIHFVSQREDGVVPRESLATESSTYATLPQYRTGGLLDTYRFNERI